MAQWYEILAGNPMRFQQFRHVAWVYCTHQESMNLWVNLQNDPNMLYIVKAWRAS